MACSWAVVSLIGTVLTLIPGVILGRAVLSGHRSARRAAAARAGGETALAESYDALAAVYAAVATAAQPWHVAALVGGFACILVGGALSIAGACAG